MTLTMAQLISQLMGIMERHGDLPVYFTDTDIRTIRAHPSRDGVMRTENGFPETPNEIVLEIIPC